MITPAIFSPSLENFLAVLVIVALVAVMWVALRFLLRLTRILFTVGCLSLLVVAVLLLAFAILGRG